MYTYVPCTQVQSVICTSIIHTIYPYLRYLSVLTDDAETYAIIIRVSHPYRVLDSSSLSVLS